MTSDDNTSIKYLNPKSGSGGVYLMSELRSACDAAEHYTQLCELFTSLAV